MGFSPILPIFNTLKFCQNLVRKSLNPSLFLECLRPATPAKMAVAESPCPPTPSPHCVELPEDVVDKIAELDLELSEGDITQKGYEKKRAKLLAPYLKLKEIKSKSNGGSTAVDPSQSASGASCDSSRVSDSSGLSVSVDANNKPRSRRTHRRYYNEKRWGRSIEQTKTCTQLGKFKSCIS